MRLERKKLLPGGPEDICPPNGEVDKCPSILEYRDKEIKDKSIENREGERARTFGHYKNILLTDAELAELQAEFPTVWESYVEKLSAYMKSTGKAYKSHAATIRRWVDEDSRNATEGRQGGLPDYSYKEGESL